ATPRARGGHVPVHGGTAVRQADGVLQCPGAGGDPWGDRGQVRAVLRAGPPVTAAGGHSRRQDRPPDRSYGPVASHASRAVARSAATPSAASGSSSTVIASNSTTGSLSQQEDRSGPRRGCGSAAARNTSRPSSTDHSPVSAVANRQCPQTASGFSISSVF